MKKITTFLDDFLKMLAVFTVLLIITGYVDLKTHYDFFGINISNYISTSEILLFSIDHITAVLLFIFLQLIIWLIFFDYLFDYTDEDIRKGWRMGERRPKLQFDHDEAIRRFFRNKKLTALIFIIFALMVLTPIVQFLIPYNKTISQISIYILVNTFVILILYTIGIQLSRKLWLISKKQKVYHSKLLVSFVIFFPVLIFSTWLNSNLSANHLRKYGNNSNIEITLQDYTKISSNDSIRYIGSTGSYHFFWTPTNLETIAYPTSQIKKIIRLKNN